MKIKLIDNLFVHAIEQHSTNSMAVCRQSEKIEWIRNFKKVEDEELIFMTDESCMKNVNLFPNAKKIAWLVEAPEKKPKLYEWISKNNKHFHKVLTFEKSLLDRKENFLFHPHGTCWILDKDVGLHAKNKLISTVMSTKNATKNHKLRHHLKNTGILKKLGVDVFGAGGEYKIPVHTDKILSLRNYMFQIVIDVRTKPWEFTEKLVDCLATGTLPIYCGPDPSKWFNIDGFLLFRNEEELINLKDKITSEYYHSKIDAIKDNLERSKQYFLIEDWIYDNLIIKDII